MIRWKMERWFVNLSIIPQFFKGNFSSLSFPSVPKYTIGPYCLSGQFWPCDWILANKIWVLYFKSWVTNCSSTIFYFPPPHQVPVQLKENIKKSQVGKSQHQGLLEEVIWLLITIPDCNMSENKYFLCKTVRFGSQLTMASITSFDYCNRNI